VGCAASQAKATVAALHGVRALRVI
jgi:hypothetical protein